jgi:hypothetical protein
MSFGSAYTENPIAFAQRGGPFSKGLLIAI